MPFVQINDVSRGVNRDLMPEELGDGVWSNVQNMRFRNGFAERFGGMANVFTTPSVTPYFITPYTTATKRFWVYAGLQKVFVDDGTTRTEITPASLFTGAIDDRWSGGSLNGVLVLNNGVDQPQYWAGNTASDLATLPGWDANERCAVLRPFKNFLFALDITKSGTRYPHMVKWSHSADPGTVPTSWDETDPTLDTDERDLAETPDLLVDCLPLGDQLIIYKERSMYSATYVGAPFIFRTTRLPGDVGMLTRGCATATPVGHVVLTAGDVIVHQGQGVQSIANGVIRRYIFNNIDSTNYKRAFVTQNPQASEVLICFPLNGSTVCDKAAVWNWEDKTWGLRDLTGVTYGAHGQADIPGVSITWDSDSEAWEADATRWDENEYAANEARLIFARNAPALSAFDTGATDFGNAIQGILTRENMTFGDPAAVKLIRGVRPKIDAAAGTVLRIEVGACMFPDQGPTWSAPATFTVGSSIKSDVFAQGRFISLRITSTNNAIWKIRSLAFDVVQTGQY